MNYHTAAPSRVLLQPKIDALPPLKRKIAVIMADGRWRTVSDIARSAKCVLGSAYRTADELAKAGILERDYPHGFVAFRYSLGKEQGK